MLVHARRRLYSWSAGRERTLNGWSRVELLSVLALSGLALYGLELSVFALRFGRFSFVSALVNFFCQQS